MNKIILFFIFISLEIINAQMSKTTILFQDKVTKSMAEEYLGTPLFMYPTSSACCFRQKPSGGWWLIGIAADGPCDRIIYGDYNDNWLRAFDEFGTGKGKFRTPIKLTSSPASEVYVVDKFNGRIVKLIYDFQNKKLFYSTSIGEGIFRLPEDVDLDIKGTLNDPCDDEIWVLDVYDSKIYHFNTNGELIDSYGERGQGVGKFSFPIGIAKSLWGNFLYVLDQGNKRIVKIKYLGQNNYQWAKEFSLNEPCYSSIEVDYEGGVWVTNMVNCFLEKFTPDLEPLCKIGKKGVGENEFILPLEISIPKGYGNIFIVEQWSDSSGGQHYIPGMDILNLNTSQNELLVKINFTITWNGKVTIVIYNQNWSYVRTLYSNYYFPMSHHTVYWDMKDYSGNFVPSGKYFIKISAQNLWSNQYMKMDTTVIMLSHYLNRPTNLSANSSYPYNSITLTWNDNSNYESGYEIWRKGINENWHSIYIYPTQGQGTGEITWTDNYVSKFKDYFYRVRAYRDGIYSEFSNEKWATTSPIIAS